MRLLLGAFGDPGHAFPMIALGRALSARGHDVTLQTWRRWETDVVAVGMAFAPAPEDPVFPTRRHPMNPYDAALPLTRMTVPLVEEVRPDAVVADVLTLAPALAAELVRRAGRDAHPPRPSRAASAGCRSYSVGARRPRTFVGQRGLAGDGTARRRTACEIGRDQLNATRGELGLPPVERLWGGMSRELCLVAHVPSARVPATLAAGDRGRRAAAVGAAVRGRRRAAARGSSRSCSSRRRRRRIPTTGCCAARWPGSRSLPVRVLAATTAGRLRERVDGSGERAVVDWVSYARTMPRCDVVVCHGGHGTVARALASGCVPVVVPAAGDMAENAARVDWAGVGVRVPRRLCTPRAVRLAVGRALARPGLRRRARELSAWAATHDGAERAAGLVERFAAQAERGR